MLHTLRKSGHVTRFSRRSRLHGGTFTEDLAQEAVYTYTEQSDKFKCNRKRELSGKHTFKLRIHNATVTLEPGWSQGDCYEQVQPAEHSHPPKSGNGDRFFFLQRRFSVNVKVPP